MRVPRTRRFLSALYQQVCFHCFNLTKLLKKDSLKWNQEAQNSFEDLKHDMTQAPILALPNISKKFVIQTDSSGIGMELFSLKMDNLFLFQ